MSQHQQNMETVGSAIAKLSPPAGVVAVQAAGWGLQDWVLVATLAYTVLMIGKLVWDWLIKPNLKRQDK